MRHLVDRNRGRCLLPDRLPRTCRPTSGSVPRRSTCAPGASPVSVAGVGYDLFTITQPDPNQTINLAYGQGNTLVRCAELIAHELPRPDVEIDVVVPYHRGDLVHRVHTEGEIDHEEHTPEGTLLRGRVAQALATELVGASAAS